MSPLTQSESTYRPPPVGHRQLAAIETVAAGEGVAVVAVECFGGLLWHKVPKATDLFSLLGYRLAAAGHLAKGVTPGSFSAMRYAAQARAGQDWPGLEEVYARLQAASVLDVAALVRAEVELQKQLSVVDLALAGTLARLALHRDLRIVVVSDTNLAGRDLRHLLDRPELERLAIEAVVSSRDLGVGKQTGMWPAVAQGLGVATDAIVHISDDGPVEVAAANLAGIRTVRYAGAPDRMPAIYRKEGTLAEEGSSSPWCDPGHGDGGAAALRSRAGLDHAGADHDDQVAWETGACILGPVFSAYGEWVHRRTAELGIGRVLCLMREGRFLRTVLDGVTPSRANPDLRCALLWVSREALARTAFTRCDEAELSSFFGRARPPRLPVLAGTLGLDLASFPKYQRIVDELPHLAGDPHVVRDFLVSVLQDRTVAAHVREVSARRRESFLRHLCDALGGVRGDVGIVDIGWAGSMQEQLQELADSENLGVRFHGLLFMADFCPAERLLRGHRIEGFLSPPGEPPTPALERMRRNRLILEQFTLSEDGSTLEIDDDGRPVCADYRPPARQASQRRAVQAGIRAFQRQADAYWESTAVAAGGTAGEQQAWAWRILERLLCEPTPEEAATFAGWEAEDNYGNMELVTLVPERDTGLLRRSSPAQLAGLAFERVLWPAAAAVLWGQGQDTGLSTALSPAGMLGIELADPAGSALGRGSVAWQLGRDGAGTAHWSGPAAGAGAIRLAPTMTPGLLRLDLVQVFLQNSSGWRSLLWTWQAGADPGALVTEQCSWVAPNILQVGPGSRLSLTLGSALPSLSEITVEICGAFLGLHEGGFRVVPSAGGAQLAFVAP